MTDVAAVEKLLATWVMVIEVCGDDKKKLAEHKNLFFQVMDMVEAVGSEGFEETMTHFYDMSVEDIPAVFAEREGKHMQKLLEQKGISKKHSEQIMDSYLMSMAHSREELVEMIFGPKLSKKILAE